MSWRIVTFVFAAWLLGSLAPARAQEETKSGTPKAEAPPEPGAAPVMPDSEVPGVESEDSAAAAPGLSPAPPKEIARADNLLWWAIDASGPIGWVLLTMSVVCVALTVKFIIELKRDKVIPPELVAKFENKIGERKYQEAYDIARSDNSFLGKVLAAGLSKLSTGYAHAIEAMQEVGEDESMRLEHRLSWLAILGTTGPLLGLLGTVEGIIRSFQTIALSDTQPKPSQLAGGISTSLFNTFEGLLVAIIATVAFMLLKNHAARLVLEVGMISGNLMSRFSSLVRPGRAGAAATGGTVIDKT